MRVSCQRSRFHHFDVLVLLAIAAIACTDPSEPPSIQQSFFLTEINGQHLPYARPATNGSPSATIVSGSLTLYNSGVAILEENQLNSVGETTVVRSRLRYKITDTTIEFSFETACPPNAICAQPPTGQLLDNGIHAEILWPPLPSTNIYRYQVSATL
jgi:hypothetical protein